MTPSRNQATVAHERQERLHPSIFHPRYYHLRQLKKTLEQVVAHHIQPHAPHQVLVDYGCGSMPYKSLFHAYVNQYLGADIASNQVADIRLEEDGRLPLHNNMADIVLSTQVLEHVPNPDLYISEAYRILKSSGLLILSTHGIWMYHPDPADYWRWTSAGLQKILEKAGFEVIDVHGIQGLASAGLQLIQDAFLYKLPHPVKWLFIPIMQCRIALADKLHTTSNRKKDACVFVMVCKKTH